MSLAKNQWAGSRYILLRAGRGQNVFKIFLQICEITRSPKIVLEKHIFFVPKKENFHEKCHFFTKTFARGYCKSLCLFVYLSTSLSVSLSHLYLSITPLCLSLSVSIYSSTEKKFLAAKGAAHFFVVH
jgi:hypothetical protein